MYIPLFYLKYAQLPARTYAQEELGRVEELQANSVLCD